ncbi:hypothetical protein PLEOSDRAFT_1063918 [Pleurotus ostreatus PC15]|uniref:Uncharacterized protein n=1 Tax=Pleurotus ostreatus (strain PC15) TaxID=1137138 RepID=A0A067NYB8_PLEO1|nr:hypothetical protein PLEOSDRAFT_1063918 [Pleurotus ostreatus PC15]
MPRILPRLRKVILEGSNSRMEISWPRRKNSKKSLYRPVPPRPTFKAADYKESILLTPRNPVTNSRDYVRHKTIPPRLRLKRRVVPSSPTNDLPREMTKEERKWWADPYLRMIGSPLRKCTLTDRYLPSDFLIRLAPMKISKALQDSNSKLNKTTRMLVPDGLEHPRFKTRKSGKSGYVICWKDAVAQMLERKSYRQILPKVPVHSLLIPQIEHLLRVRILQEFALLSERLQSNPRTAYSPMVLRRLTRKEWESMKTSGTVAWPDAVAIIVIPPVNRDPLTKKRPEPSMYPPPADVLADCASSSKHPISILYPVQRDVATPLDISQLEVPLYNGVPLFPNPGQRAALHQYLTAILNSETRRPSRSGELDGIGADDKPSHAFLLVSNAETCKRADVAATAMALWRFRMFYGAGWEAENMDHWVTKESKKRRTA